MNRSIFKTKVSLRLALYRNEVARLPHTSYGVTVREGVAWMTVQGQDKILRKGDGAMFEPGRFPAVVTALGDTPLILEVMGGERRRSASLTPTRLPGRPVCGETVA